MTTQQEQAIQLLLRLTQSKAITDEEHILLLDFIVRNNEPTITYTPFIQLENPCIDPNGNGVCTNPFRDCVNCPRTFDSGKGTWMSNDTKLTEK